MRKTKSRVDHNHAIRPGKVRLLKQCAMVYDGCGFSGYCQIAVVFPMNGLEQTKKGMTYAHIDNTIDSHTPRTRIDRRFPVC